MRLAMLARATNRGLGCQTFEFYRHMKPQRTLVLDLGHDRDPYALHAERFPDAWGCVTPEQLTEPLLREFLSGMDVLYSAETFYNYDLPAIARRFGVRTVLQGNFEFLPYVIDAGLPKPDLFMAPSSWRYDEWPTPKVLLPFPVDRRRLGCRRRQGASTFLHVAGHPTMADRNGTQALFAALRHVTSPITVIVTSQQPIPARMADRISRHVTLDVRVGDVGDYWLLPYEEADVLVLPRRWGGLSLQVNEAQAAGLPIIATDVEPQRSFLPPEGLVPAADDRLFPGQPGRVTIHDADHMDLARTIDRFATDPDLVTRLSLEADRHAESISWDRLGPHYVETLQSLVDFPISA